jgi:hypothetical protein
MAAMAAMAARAAMAAMAEMANPCSQRNLAICYKTFYVRSLHLQTLVISQGV